MSDLVTASTAQGKGDRRLMGGWRVAGSTSNEGIWKRPLERGTEHRWKEMRE